MGRGRRAAGYVLVTAAVIGAMMLHRRLPWIPLPYLAALIGVPVAWWHIVRRSQQPLVRWPASALAVAVVVALLPVPWMKAPLADPPGSAWRLDGRLEIDGEVIDPPGTWYWLTVGRPPIVAEVAWSWLTHEPAPVSMHNGRRAQRPNVVEPAAAAVGLRRAGLPIELGLLVEASRPTLAGLPKRVVVTELNGTALTTREIWDRVTAQLGETNTFTTDAGESYEFAGSILPFGRVDVIESPRRSLDVSVGGLLARTLPGAWYRDLSLGASHGLMVALVAYAHGSGRDLAQGRAIAGTGTIRSDGSVGAIIGLRAKATAARDIGADVLLFPAQLVAQLADFDARSMRLAPVHSLDEAIEVLAAPVKHR